MELQVDVHMYTGWLAASQTAEHDEFWLILIKFIEKYSNNYTATNICIIDIYFMVDFMHGRTQSPATHAIDLGEKKILRHVSWATCQSTQPGQLC